MHCNFIVLHAQQPETILLRLHLLGYYGFNSLCSMQAELLALIC